MIFLVESIIKCIALCLWQPKGSYLRDQWNSLDFIVTVLTIASLAFTSLTFFRSLRAVRTLRLLSKSHRTRHGKSCALRFIFHNGSFSIRLVVEAFISAVIPVLHVLGIVGLIWVMFAVLGVGLWKGQFYYCTDPTRMYERFSPPPYVFFPSLTHTHSLF